MLDMGLLFVLDTYDYLDECKASRVNSHYQLAKIVNNEIIKSVLNCTIVYDKAKKIAKIRSIKNIQRFEELFVTYRGSFHFVDE